MDKVNNIYMLTANVRELLRQHEMNGNVQLSLTQSQHYGYQEVKTLEEIISTHIFWLNEALHELKDRLAMVVNPLYKPAPQWKNFVLFLSAIFNVFLIISLIILLV